MRYFYLVLVLFFIYAVPANAQITEQQQQQLDALNNYVHFTNESVHGLLIVHRLLENFNQKINKYVDLESNQFNFYSNKDLPQNIFLDEEQWFYDVSPYAWHDVTLTESSHLPTALANNLNKEVAQLKSIITRVNSIRFELDHLTKPAELKQLKNLDKIYQKLEECVTLYENFNTIKQELKLKLEQGYTQLNLERPSATVETIVAIHENIRVILVNIHKGEDVIVEDLFKHLGNNLMTAMTSLGLNATAQAVLQKASSFHETTKLYLKGGGLPTEYQQYGQAYYYYNVELVSKVNRYGAGIVTDMNAWIKRTNKPSLLLLEEPHFFKVIYPKREIKVEKAEIKPAGQLPSTVKGREVVVRQNEIRLDDPTFLLEISDSQTADGDVISLNFNDHWIVKDYTLKRKPLKLQLRLKTNQTNYLILHAENMGTTPPNTAKISYIYDGEKRVILLSSDETESEMIELKLGK